MEEAFDRVCGWGTPLSGRRGENDSPCRTPSLDGIRPKTPDKRVLYARLVLLSITLYVTKVQRLNMFVGKGVSE